MGMNQNYFYDFDAEPAIGNWVATRLAQGLHKMSSTFTLPAAGEHTLLFAPRHPPEKWKILSVQTAGREFQAYESAIAYISPNSSGGWRYAFHVDLPAGVHALELRVQSNIDHPELGFKATWIAAERAVERRPGAAGNGTTKMVQERRQDAVTTTEAERERRQDAGFNVLGFTPGVGAENNPSAGRFGYTKGDGVLDCAMPMLGVIDKLYLCGHPRYKKPYKWTYAVLPPGLDPAAARHGSAPPAQVGLENDEISVNHLSVRWQASFAATADFFERQAGAKVNFACTYSLASPGILVETSDPGFSLSMLEYAGNYQSILVPQKDGVKSVPLDGDFSLAGKLAENWLLLFDATEFPDVPVLLVFLREPDAVRVRRNRSGRLTALDFHLPAASGQDTKVFCATPFGIESLVPEALRGEKCLADAISRCRFWSRAFLAYPVKCAEYFKLDEAAEKVEILQKFEYRVLADQWQTSPLKTAPLPPALALLDGTGMAEWDADVRDYEFPSKYGFLKGAVGRDYVSYKIPYMPRARRFPLRDAGDTQISPLLADGMDQYFQFHDNFGKDQQAYPYAGAALEPYAWPAPMFNFLGEKHRAKLSAKLAERVACACDPERHYTYPVISWSALMREMPAAGRVLDIYRDPAIKKMKLFNWYWRKEPFTGVEYRICYLNVGLFSGATIKQGSREEIAGLKMPLIENDWGAGLAFYYIYLAAQISGDFSAIRKNWGLLCEGFDYFAKLHDWACMATAYSDNGISWVEGANYGAFTGFVNLAEALGDQDARAKGVYIAAKQFALRLAQFVSAATYFYRYLDHKPWYITKLFHEEAAPGAGFLHVPELWRDEFAGIYNLTTEGMYPEVFAGLNEFLPKEWQLVREMAMQAYADGYKNSSLNSYGEVQGCASCLIAAALDEKYNAARLQAELDRVEQRGHLIREWRGIHIYSRLLPKNYFKCQLLAWLAGRAHPVWLEFWVDVAIQRAEYDAEKRVAAIEFRARAPGAWLRCGTRRAPSDVRLNGKPLHGWRMEKNRLVMPVAGSGILELLF